ncbi:MAG: DUF1800 domain-containing protein [Acidobacteriaceae bacterium]|nr:DUF1800 domain-containing protein [Acidobacteriaceae bacterium]
MRTVGSVAAVALLLGPAFAGGWKIKPIKASANPPRYAAFSRLLPKDERFGHAIEKLTFGARPGDLDEARQMGLEKWLDRELHPERVAENPALGPKLAELESLQMSAREMYLHYPPPQMIAAVARGRANLPEDPELRLVVSRLADRYLQKQDSQAAAGADGQAIGNPNNANDDADLAPRIRLSDILTVEQMETLRSGRPEDKKRLLASIAPEKRLDFVWALRPEQRRQLFTVAPVALRRELMLSVNPQGVVASDLTEAKLLRAIYSNRQLEELLVDFWFNHFNVFLNKGGDRYLTPAYERDAIRPHVFGKFYDLLVATAESPAMLFYLDNWQSVAPTAVGPNPNRNKRGLNENYGRELLELHTLGVDGGYTQKDVIEVARCFTGWTIANPRKGGAFEYNDKVHDKGQKVVLGHVIAAGGGMDDGLEALRILADHPSTAYFISLQLARRFVADDPPPSLVNRMALTFGKTGGDLRAVMQTMLASPEFWSQGAYRAKIKTPFEMVVSAMRATNADVESAFALGNELQKLGEPLYRKAEPTGYSSANAEWVSTAALLERMNFAVALAHNRIPGVVAENADWRTVGSPDFQRK